MPPMTWRISKQERKTRLLADPPVERLIREGAGRRDLNEAVSACISGLLPRDRLVIQITSR